MKSSRALLLFCLTALQFAFPIGAADIAVASSSGAVFTAKTPQGPWVEIKEAKGFAAPLWFKTSTNSSVELALPGKSRAKLSENTLLLVAEIAATGAAVSVDLELEEGRFLCIANLPTAASKFQLLTSHCVAGVRNTVTTFEASAKGILRCESGTLVAVYILAGVPSQPETIASGDQTSISPGPTIKREQIAPETAKELARDLGKLRANAGL